jgi:chemotaxis signal transduction protein
VSAISEKAEASVERESVTELRRAFDQTFAAPPAAGTEGVERLIVIRLSGESFVLRADQTTGLFKARRIVPIPSRIPELLGLAGIRGTVVPVFDLSAILQLQSRGSIPVWLVLAGRDLPIALAFDELERQVELSRASLYADESPVPRRHVQLLARIGSSAHPVIDIPSILEEIRRKADPRGQMGGINL